MKSINFVLILLLLLIFWNSYLIYKNKSIQLQLDKNTQLLEIISQNTQNPNTIDNISLSDWDINIPEENINLKNNLKLKINNWENITISQKDNTDDVKVINYQKSTNYDLIKSITIEDLMLLYIASNPSTAKSKLEKNEKISKIIQKYKNWEDILNEIQEFIDNEAVHDIKDNLYWLKNFLRDHY